MEFHCSVEIKLEYSTKCGITTSYSASDTYTVTYTLQSPIGGLKETKNRVLFCVYVCVLSDAYTKQVCSDEGEIKNKFPAVDYHLFAHLSIAICQNYGLLCNFQCANRVGVKLNAVLAVS